MRRKAIKLCIELVLPVDKKTNEIIRQFEDFILDLIPVEDSFHDWEPFDCGAYGIDVMEDHDGAYIDIDEEAELPPPFIRKLDTGFS